MNELPAGWVWTTLGEVSSGSVDQLGPQTSEFTYVDISSIDTQSKRIVSPKWLSSENAPSRARQNVKCGDVLISLTRPNLNAVALIDSEYDSAVASTGFHIVRPLGVEPRWIHFFVQSRIFVEKLVTRVQGVVYPAVRPKDVGDMDIPLPPLAEQRRIVADIEKQFTRVDEATQILHCALTKLKRAHGAVFASVVSAMRLENQNGERSGFGANIATAQTKSLPDRTILLPNRRGWDSASLDQLTTRITSGSRDWSPYYGRGTGTFLLAQNVRPRKLDLSVRQSVDPPANDASRERSAVRRGDLLVTIVGANTGDVCAVNEDLNEHYVCQSVALMRPLTPDLTSYLVFYLTDEHFGRRIWKQYAYGAGRPHLSFEQLKKTAVLLPPNDLIPRLTYEMEAIESVIQSSQKSVLEAFAHSARLRQAILAKAFSGQLVPQDPNDEPASVLLERIRTERVRGAPKPRRTRSKQLEPAIPG